MAKVVVHSRTRPHNALDAFVTVVSLLLIAAATTLVAFGVLDLVLASDVAAVLGLAVAALLLIAIGARAVRSLELDDTGIRFDRVFGSPTFLEWEHITSIRPADRAEVVLRGWLVPPYPPRGDALTLTSLGHYRIDWKGGGYRFFPPADVPTFLAVVERNWGGLL